MTIEVKNTREQIVDIFATNVNQEIDIANVSEQRIDLTEGNISQDISIENERKQEVGVGQDVLLVPDYDAVPRYEGLYAITPKIEAQTLPTAKKLMMKDFTIRRIPYFEVGNNSGGDTVYIANIIPMVILGEAILGEVTL